MKRIRVGLVAMLAFGGTALYGEQSTQVYGYLNAYVEKVAESPEIGGETTQNPFEYDVPNMNLIMNSTSGRFGGYLNLNLAGMEMANAWVQVNLCEELLSFRFGKMYRPFGLYNEILDATPTYIGIEPPELFDGDHLLLTRTTNAMLRGKAELGPGYLHYAVTTGQDERTDEQIPIGADVHYQLGSNFKIGGSYYTTNGQAKGHGSLGGGKPKGGVLNWMEYDKYQVFGGYAQYRDSNLTVQVASYLAKHKAVRDEALVAELCTESLNSAQQTRFACAADQTLEKEVSYDVSTTYVRAGYNIRAMDMTFTPYAQYDIYSNPETVFPKSAGGDKEAGLADDGKFAKWTLGLVVRPQFDVAVKLDYSQHQQKVEGESTNYGEIRFSFSYFWNHS